MLLISFLGFGCGLKKMAAKNADYLIESQIEKRLPLYSSQKAQLSKDVNKFLNEQKAFAKEAVPAITSLELDASKVNKQYDYLNTLYRKLALNFSNLMSRYMAQLDEKQQKEFKENLEDENRTLAKLDDSDRLEKIEDRFERMFGSISLKQKKIFEQLKSHFEERHKLRLARRQALHNKFMQIYKMDLSQESRTKYFSEAFEEYQKSYPQSPKDKEIIKVIIPTLSKAQKESFEEKTNDIKDILNYYLDIHY